MIILRIIENRRGNDLCGNRAAAVAAQRFLVSLSGGLSELLLFIVTGVDTGAVLGTPVVTLAHALGGVMTFPESGQ